MLTLESPPNKPRTLLRRLAPDFGGPSWLLFSKDMFRKLAKVLSDLLENEDVDWGGAVTEAGIVTDFGWLQRQVPKVAAQSTSSGV